MKNKGNRIGKNRHSKKQLYKSIKPLFPKRVRKFLKRNKVWIQIVIRVVKLAWLITVWGS